MTMNMYYLISAIIFSMLIVLPAHAGEFVDSDGDKVSDYDETTIYHTNPNKADTDDDGYDDRIELNSGFSPFSVGKTLENNDFDQDGLSDKLEYHFKTDPTSVDTDADGFLDGMEVWHGYDPSKAGEVRLEKRINIDTKNQLLSYYTGDVRLGMFSISTGKPGMATPAGEFVVLEKTPWRWSSMAKLWMPYWLMFDKRGYGIHELPQWPDGTKEGANHLGTPVSHGCVRLGVGPAQELYNFAELGTKVYIN